VIVGSPTSSHAKIRRKLLGEAYAFALSVARRADLSADSDFADSRWPREAGARPMQSGRRPSDSLRRYEETALWPEDGFSDSPQVDHQGEVSR
jgi:hypothetical protein